MLASEGVACPDAFIPHSLPKVLPRDLRDVSDGLVRLMYIPSVVNGSTNLVQGAHQKANGTTRVLFGFPDTSLFVPRWWRRSKRLKLAVVVASAWVVVLYVVVYDRVHVVGELGVFGEHPPEHGSSTRQDFNLGDVMQRWRRTAAGWCLLQGGRECFALEHASADAFWWAFTARGEGVLRS